MALNFSDADKEKYITGQYLKEIKLYFPQLNLTVLNDEIYEESLSLEEAIFDGNSALSIIGCISNRFSIDIRNKGVKLKKKNIQVSIRIDGGEWQRIFTGYVDSVENVRDRSYQKLMCFDVLYKYSDKNFYNTYAALNFPITIKTLRDAIFSYIGIQQQVTDLANDTVTISKTIEDGELAVIDALRAVCQMNGVFGKIDAYGIFKYVDVTVSQEIMPYPNLIYPDQAYPASGRGDFNYIDSYREGSLWFDDYSLAELTGVTVRDGISDTEYGSYGSTGNMLLIEGNIWCNGLGQSVKNTIAHNIFEKVRYIAYQPFNVTVPGLPYIECGDSITLYVYDYSSGEPETVVMAFSVLTRYLKGMQWMTDAYDAKGNEYQPEVIPIERSSGGNSRDVEQVKKDVSELQTEVSGKQNFINSDLLVPTGSGSTGDLCFYSPNGDGDNRKDLYRYENGHWVEIFPVNVITDAVTPTTIGKLRNIVISNYDIGAGAQLDEGTIYLVVD